MPAMLPLTACCAGCAQHKRDHRGASYDCLGIRRILPCQLTAFFGLAVFFDSRIRRASFPHPRSP